MKLKFMLVSVITLVLLVVVSGFSVAPKTYAMKNEDFVIVIDPGHGGIDPGVIGVKTGVKESQLNLYTANALKELFYADHKSCVLTRNADVGLYGTAVEGFKNRDLKRRVEISKEVGGDIFISVHMNEYKDSSRRGAQVFFRAGDEKSRLLAQNIQDELNALKESTRLCSPLAGDYYVLNYAVCPAVIVECGFLSNSEEEKLLLTEEYREKIAYSIYYGVLNFLGETDFSEKDKV